MDMARFHMKMISKLTGMKKYWEKVVKTANFIRNRMITESCRFDGKTSYESVMKKKPDISFLQTFGSKAFVHIPEHLRKGKCFPRSKEGIIMAYAV